jgi:hypothetical protein
MPSNTMFLINESALLEILHGLQMVMRGRAKVWKQWVHRGGELEVRDRLLINLRWVLGDQRRMVGSFHFILNINFTKKYKSYFKSNIFSDKLSHKNV